VIRENELADYVVFIRDGDFQVVKERFTDEDRELLEFLDEQHLTNEQELTKKVSMLRGN